MKEVKIETTLQIYDDLTELPVQVQSLMHKAIEVRETAYAPYSKFNVGAAILLENDEIVVGSNQENASYPSGLCAERTAIYYANAKFPDVRMRMMALTASSRKRLLINL
jgi:cytidine deaminase